MILYNILLLSLKISGNIKCFQLHNKSIAPFLRLTEFKMFKTIEWLYLILSLFIINKRCMCWKNNPQVDFFLFCCFMNQLCTKISKDYLISTCLLCFCCCFCSFACFFYCLMGMFLSSFGLEFDRITFPVINKYCTKDL